MFVLGSVQTFIGAAGKIMFLRHSQDFKRSAFDHDKRKKILSWVVARCTCYHRSTIDTSAKLATKPKESRYDVPLRAQSVNLAERPRSHYARSVRSADPNRLRFPEKLFQHRPPSVDKKKPKPTKVLVKQQKRKAIEKIPCAISVQNLSIPMKYADPTSTQNLNSFRIDNRTKSSNPPKQVGDKRLCAVGAKETENKLLVQISEAEQVSDFERILNSNAILSERARGPVWRGSGPAHSPTGSTLRPRSSYSLRAVSQAYHYLFRQHEDSLQPLIDRYRQTLAADDAAQNTLLINNFENLQGLQEFYDDDHALRREVETVKDQLIREEIHVEEAQCGKRQKNFNVNLAGLIDLHVTGEGFSPVRVGRTPDADVDKPSTDDEEEWLAPSMSADDRHALDNSDSIDCLAQTLNNVKLDRDVKVPTITFSNCSNGTRSESPNNKDVIHLAVPSIESIDETRPPMM